MGGIKAVQAKHFDHHMREREDAFTQFSLQICNKQKNFYSPHEKIYIIRLIQVNMKSCLFLDIPNS